MPILKITRDFAGQVGVDPCLVRIVTNNTFAEITATNYLQSAKNQGFAFYPTDLCAVAYGSSSNITEWFSVNLTSTSITLVPNAGTITQPVTTGDFAVFGANGTLQDLGYIPSNAAKTTVPMINAAPVSGNISKFTDNVGTIGDASLAANKLLSTTIVSPDISPNLVRFNITVNQVQLQTGASAILYASSGSSQYRIVNLQLNAGGTNFSGGGGNRNAQITDNTTVYSVIPAATLQSLANAQWGTTGLPNPTGSTSINTPTQPAQSLVLQYVGGTTDYTAGVLTITGTLERIA